MLLGMGTMCLLFPHRVQKVAERTSSERLRKIAASGFYLRYLRICGGIAIFVATLLLWGWLNTLQ